MATPTRTVLIVDDQEPFRSIARTVVSLTPGFEVVGEAGDGEEAVELAARLTPGVVLMDLHLPVMTGVEATRQIVAADPMVAVVLLSTYRVEDLPADAQHCGAALYVRKEHFGPDVLLGLLPAGTT